MPETVEPRNLRPKIEQKLQPNESILWVGRPQLQRFQSEKWGEMGLGVLLASVAVVGAIVISLVLIYDRDWTVLFVLPVPLGFAWHAFNYLRAPARYSQIVGQALYAVTNQRAMVLNGFGFSRRMNLEVSDREDIQSFPLSSGGGPHEVRRRRDGTADFVFAGESRGSGRHSGRYVEFGFFGIEDADSLTQILKQVLEK